MAKWFEMNQWEKRNGDRAEMSLVLDMKWRESKPPPVSIEDRTVVGPADRV